MSVPTSSKSTDLDAGSSRGATRPPVARSMPCVSSMSGSSSIESPAALDGSCRSVGPNRQHTRVARGLVAAELQASPQICAETTVHLDEEQIGCQQERGHQCERGHRPRQVVRGRLANGAERASPRRPRRCTCRDRAGRETPARCTRPGRPFRRGRADRDTATSPTGPAGRGRSSDTSRAAAPSTPSRRRSADRWCGTGTPRWRAETRGPHRAT